MTLNFEHIRGFATRRAGTVQAASIVWARSAIFKHAAGKGRSSTQNAGLRYELRISKLLSECYEGFLPQVTFSFLSGLRRETCILDGICFWHRDFVKRELLLVEIKLSHCYDAWHQLRLLYAPVVQVAFPGYTLRLLEVCKNYEACKLPEPYKLHRSIEDFIKSGDSFGVVSIR